MTRPELIVAIDSFLAATSGDVDSTSRRLLSLCAAALKAADTEIAGLKGADTPAVDPPGPTPPFSLRMSPELRPAPFAKKAPTVE